MIKIIVDSTVYLKKDEADSLSLQIIPVSYSIDGRNYLESYSDENGNFESLLKFNSNSLTAQPNMEAFLSAFEEQLSMGSEVLCITISSRLSGTYSAAYTAAKKTGSEKITVFDSRLTAGGMYLLVLEARRLIDEGNDLKETVKNLMDIRDKITVAFSVDDMTPLRNSGRISLVPMSVRTILNIKPILLCREGVVVSDSIAHGNSDIIKKLAEKIPLNVKIIVVNYIKNSRMASNLYNIIREKLPFSIIKLQKMGPVLGIHLGLQVVAVSFIAN